MAKIILNVPDITCGHCAQTIKKVLTPVRGVQNVGVDITARKVQLEYDEQTVQLDYLKELLQEEGYPVASVEGGVQQSGTRELQMVATSQGGCGCHK
jgi:copper chaperone